MRAIDVGLVGCHDCGSVHDANQSTCRICNAPLQSRRKNSTQKAWAWLITGVLFLIPGNLFPLLINSILGSTSGHTILEGVILFYEAGNYTVALVILVASFVLPIAKILIIAFLLLSIEFRWAVDHHKRLIMYEFIELVGRWSMIDIFVVALLVGLVQLGPVATIQPAIGCLAFAASVICTMLSAQSIDPKLIWDGPGR
ncbi:MAG: paraquat-inducible protein A [Pseudomonadota bacterium]